MKNIIKMLLFILVLSNGYSFNRADFDREYSDIVTNWLENGSVHPGLIDSLDLMSSKITELDQNDQTLLWNSKTLLLKGYILFEREERRQSLRALKESKKFAEESLEIAESSEGWRLMADAGSFTMVQKGLTYIIVNSGKIQEQAERALSLNKDNARASLVTAQGLFNAPESFGGDRDRGLQEIVMLSMRQNLSMEDHYFMMMALADAYESLDRFSDAQDVYRELQNRYPANQIISKKLKNPE